MHSNRPLLAAMSPLALTLFGCHGKGEGTPLPAAGTFEPVELIWEGAAFPGAMPSVVRHDSAWQLYFTGKEGSIEAVLHARSEDGLSFQLLSSHRVADDLVTIDSDAVTSAVAYSSGSRVHLLCNARVSGSRELWHATATDGDDFVLGDAPVFSEAAGDVPYLVTGAVYEASEVVGAFSDGSGAGASEVLVARSTDSGATWPEPGAGLAPNDLPTPWGSSTAGAGGMWSATVAADPEGGYHMLYLGAAPNGADAIGIGEAWSGDGELWSSNGELWYEAEDGVTINGLSLVEHEGGWNLWVGLATDEANPLNAGSFAMMRIE